MREDILQGDRGAPEDRAAPGAGECAFLLGVPGTGYTYEPHTGWLSGTFDPLDERAGAGVRNRFARAGQSGQPERSQSGSQEPFRNLENGS